MSGWLGDGEVLVGRGSGEAVPVSPGPRGVRGGSPRSACSRSPLASPTAKEATPGGPQAETMGKARELFVLCDKEGKGFITKRDMQRLQEELPLSPEQLDTVFESLDQESNGFLTPVEFNKVLGDLMVLDSPGEDQGQETWCQDPAALRFLNILIDLEADKFFSNQQELSYLWCELQRDRPELLALLEGLLLHAVSCLHDSLRERDSLERALCRRESEHERAVRSIYEDVENQLREERERYLAQDSVKQRLRGEQLEKELTMREQELENILTTQKELEVRIRQLSCERTNVKEQNQQLRSFNAQLQEQLEASRDQLQEALAQLSLLQLNAAREQVARQRNVMKVSTDMQKEKASLLRQLELLRDMNQRLRDEKDAQTPPRRPHRDRRAPPPPPLTFFLSEDLCSPWTQQIHPPEAS